MGKNRLKRAQLLTRCALFLGAGALACSAPDSVAAGHGASPNKPNVVLLFIDDLGYGDIGPNGCKDIPTPNIDKLAETGSFVPHSTWPLRPAAPAVMP